MAKLRPARCYRDADKNAYTRRSKYQKKAYVKGIPGSKVVLFDMGDRKTNYGFRVSLISREVKQIRHNSLESARLACLRRLDKTIAASGFYFKIKTFPHQILRENPIAAGAGADRYSTGMTLAFGKPISSAARIRVGQEVMYVDTVQANIDKAKTALKKASDKIGCKFDIVVSEKKK